MPGSLNNQSNFMSPRKIYAQLYMLRTCGIDNIDWISGTTTCRVWTWETSIVVEVVADCTDGVCGLPCGSGPIFCDDRTERGVIGWLTWVTDCARWRGGDELSREGRIESRP